MLRIAALLLEATTMSESSAMPGCTGVSESVRLAESSQTTGCPQSKTSLDEAFSAIRLARRVTISAMMSLRSQLLPVPGGPFTETRGPKPSPARRMPETAACWAR